MWSFGTAEATPSLPHLMVCCHQRKALRVRRQCLPARLLLRPRRRVLARGLLQCPTCLPRTWPRPGVPVPCTWPACTTSCLPRSRPQSPQSLPWPMRCQRPSASSSPMAPTPPLQMPSGWRLSTSSCGGEGSTVDLWRRLLFSCSLPGRPSMPLTLKGTMLGLCSPTGSRPSLALALLPSSAGSLSSPTIRRKDTGKMMHWSWGVPWASSCW
mmetsp:Transcript_23109/g.67323  ORF Transcript_23109/g.67323 Transcript_23109/m.67323 type:complete len:212 (+) Transcript_23109:2161-2796(+)